MPYFNTKYTAKSVDANAVKNGAAVVVHGKTGDSVATYAPNKDLTGRRDTIISNGRVKDVAGGAQNAFSDMIQAANSNISYTNRYGGLHQLITTVTTTIGGLSRDFLQFAGTKRFRSILYKETRRIPYTVGLTRDYKTGEYTSTPTTYEFEFKQDGGTLSDDAAKPTRLVPGEFVVIIGDPSDPELKDYLARTG